MTTQPPAPTPPKHVRKHYRRPVFDEDPAICLDQLDVYRSHVEAELIRQRYAAGRGGVRVTEDDGYPVECPVARIGGQG